MYSFDAYKLYLALKNHFTQDSYDFIKYEGKTTVKPETFEANKQKVFYQKLAKHEDLQNFLIANFVENPKIFVTQLAYADKPQKIYKEWIKRKQSISYTFKQDLEKLEQKFDDNFISKEGEHPPLLKKFLGKEISLETFCIILELAGAEKHWIKKLKYDLVWENTKRKVKKYLPFIEYDKDKFKQILIDFYS